MDIHIPAWLIGTLTVVVPFWAGYCWCLFVTWFNKETR